MVLQMAGRERAYASPVSKFEQIACSLTLTLVLAHIVYLFLDKRSSIIGSSQQTLIAGIISALCVALLLLLVAFARRSQKSCRSWATAIMLVLVVALPIMDSIRAWYVWVMLLLG